MTHAYTKLHADIGRIWIPCHRRGAPRGSKYTIKPVGFNTHMCTHTHTHTHAATWAKFLDKSLKSQKLGKLVAEIEAAGGTAAACHLDVTKEDTYETLFSEFSMAELYFHRFARTFPPSFCAEFAEARFGGVDHIFLNAGATTKLVGPGDMDAPEGAWNRRC